MTLQDTFGRWATGSATGSSGSPLAARAIEQLPFWVSLMAVILIGYYLAKIVWLLLPTGTAPEWQPPMPVERNPAQATSASAYKSISQTHLFGEASSEALPTGDEALSAPDTSLSLQLRGAIAADDPRYAHAIIADSNGNERVYFTNASLPGGVTLQRVQSDLVVLSRSGQLEILRLPREGQGTAAPSPTASASPRPVAAPAQANVQELVSQNAAGFLEVVRPQPFMPNGQLKGYRIYPGPNRQQFSALGLRPGDLVTEINGITLNNPAQGMEVFRSLGEASQVTVTVERDGQPQVLSLNMAQISSVGGATQ